MKKQAPVLKSKSSRNTVMLDPPAVEATRIGAVGSATWALMLFNNLLHGNPWNKVELVKRELREL
jgi:hypothetical protein